jgi:hypothetical protein
MKIRLLERIVALGLAAVINLALLGSIEFLAGRPDAGALWAAAGIATRA